MDRPVEHYWTTRLNDLTSVLEKNNFEVHTAEDCEHAKRIVLEKILPATDAKSISWGGSKSFTESGLYDVLKKRQDLEILDTYDKALSPEQKQELRRKALLVDLFFTGTNALVETGKLVNLDMHGNRVGALTFGPKHVVVVAGRNKIVADLEEAFFRVKNYAAPTNAMRLDMKTPCVKTSYCEECKSPERICNVWTIHEKCFPPKRIKVVLINQDLGL